MDQYDTCVFVDSNENGEGHRIMAEGFNEIDDPKVRWEWSGHVHFGLCSYDHITFPGIFYDCNQEQIAFEWPGMIDYLLFRVEQEYRC